MPRVPQNDVKLVERKLNNRPLGKFKIKPLIRCYNKKLHVLLELTNLMNPNFLNSHVETSAEKYFL